MCAAYCQVELLLYSPRVLVAEILLFDMDTKFVDRGDMDVPAQEETFPVAALLIIVWEFSFPVKCSIHHWLKT